LEVIEARLKSDEKEISAFFPAFRAKGVLQVLPITVPDDLGVDPEHLKKLKDEIYWVRTDTGDKARMLNYEGMRLRLYALLEARFVA
jgi:hypothetical protein